MMQAITPVSPTPSPSPAAAKTGGLFDYSKYGQRSVVLQLMYVGWSYQGFARQADSDNTIEVCRMCV